MTPHRGSISGQKEPKTLLFLYRGKVVCGRKKLFSRYQPPPPPALFRCFKKNELRLGSDRFGCPIFLRWQSENETSKKPARVRDRQQAFSKEKSSLHIRVERMEKVCWFFAVFGGAGV